MEDSGNVEETNGFRKVCGGIIGDKSSDVLEVLKGRCLQLTSLITKRIRSSPGINIGSR